MNVLIASGIAYTLPRGLSYAYNRLCASQNLEQENNPHQIADSIPYAIKTLFGFLLASVYDSVWMAIPLFSILATPCGALMGVTAILGLAVVIEIIREWMECFFEPGDRTPCIFRTSYPVQNIFVRIALKALMLPPIIFLPWIPIRMMGSWLAREFLFSPILTHATGTTFVTLGTCLVSLVALWGWITFSLFVDLFHHLYLGFFIEDYFKRETDVLGPDERCHILQAPMTDPVRLYRCRHLFERKALIEWIRLPGFEERRCPSCRERIWTKGDCEAERSTRERERSARERERQWAEAAPQRAAAAAEAAARERSARIENERREQAEMEAARDNAERDDMERVRRIVTRAR